MGLGLLLVDGTYLFVPDNERHEKSSVLWFDEHNHPTNAPKTAEERRRVHLRRCYRAIEVLHTNRKGDYAAYAGFQMGSGTLAESPCLGPMMEPLVGALPSGAVTLAIYDRGFIDGKTVTHLKMDLGVDSLFPMRRDMQDWKMPCAWPRSTANPGRSGGRPLRRPLRYRRNGRHGCSEARRDAKRR